MATIPNTTAPAQNDYGGDEVSSLVLDPGSWSIRAGFSGEDVPKSVVPTHYGRTAAGELIFGDDLHIWRQGVDIRNPMDADGTVQDWDTAEKLFKHAFTSRLIKDRPTRDPASITGRSQNSSGNKNSGSGAGVGGGADEGEAMDVEDTNGDDDDDDDDANEEGLLREHPLLMTEQGHNSARNRERSIELAMESWKAPAFWMAKTGVLAAFASGKATALVVDVGASSTNVTAVHDGLALKKSLQRSPLAGNFVSDQIRLLLARQDPPYRVAPYGWVTSKTVVDAHAAPNATYRKHADGSRQPGASLRRFEEERVLQAVKEYVVQVWPGHGGPAKAAADDLARLAQPPRAFEFPDGYNVLLGQERFRLAEGIFDPSAALTAAEGGSGAGAGEQAEGGQGRQPAEASASLVSLIKSSLDQVDVDARMLMLQNVVVTGSSSLLNGFTERLQAELAHLYPSARVRISAPGNPYERKYGPWIGGSILSSLGSFHQMWISKKEYDEFGASIVEKRCK